MFHVYVKLIAEILLDGGDLPDSEMITDIKKAVSIPVMAKVRCLLVIGVHAACAR